MILDTHVHSAGISLCSSLSVEELADIKKSRGYDGVILTNHCQAWYESVKDLKKWAEDFLAEYERGKRRADKIGLKMFLGIEVTVTVPEYADYLLYGATEEFIKKTAGLCFGSQSDMYRACRDYGVFMVQAHPFRGKIRPQDPAYLDGIEINCQPADVVLADKSAEFAKENGLTVTCGTDFHHSAMKDYGGMIVPDGINSAESFADYLRKTDYTEVFFGGEIRKYKNYGKSQI